MNTFLLRKLAVVAALALAPAGSTACTVEELPPPGYEADYEPQYYDGYVVYYDDVGRPYYYMDGSVVWVSPGSPYYHPLVGYWRLHARGYHRWYAYRGYRYRGYRYHRR